MIKQVLTQIHKLTNVKTSSFKSNSCNPIFIQNNEKTFNPISELVIPIQLK